MTRMTGKTWSRAVLLFFAWGFVMHATGLLLHEFGGHGLASLVFGCGIDGYKLTFFGHGQVHYAPCTRWTQTTILVADWSGLALTTAAGAAAAVLLRRATHPMTRLLLALLAFFFLLGQLGYATAGGFHDLYDPGRTAKRLGALGLHWIAWVPPLLAYSVAAFTLAQSAVDAFREHFGSRSRIHALVQMVLTLGIGGALYFAAYRIEWRWRTDLAMRGVAVEAERIAAVHHGPPPFPIELVLTSVAVLALGAALVTPVRAPVADSAASALAPGLVRFVSAATALYVLVMLALVLR
jgi:hypothetical protein